MNSALPHYDSCSESRQELVPRQVEHLEYLHNFDASNEAISRIDQLRQI